MLMWLHPETVIGSLNTALCVIS